MSKQGIQITIQVGRLPTEEVERGVKEIIFHLRKLKSAIHDSARGHFYHFMLLGVSQKMKRSSTAALLVAFIAHTWAQCPQGALKLTQPSVFSLARNVLLGRDITPTRPCSFSDLKLCRRRQIQFELYCTLKKMDNFSYRKFYFIGENRTVDQCDATFMEYNDRNDLVIALVTYKRMPNGDGFLDWDEVIPGHKAIYRYDNATIGAVLNATCDLDEFLQGSTTAFCPTQAPMVKCHNRFRNLLTVVFQNSNEQSLGRQCCKALSTRLTDVSVNETNADAVIPSYATARMPSVYIGALREDVFFDSNAMVTVAMSTFFNNKTMVHWLVANARLKNDGQVLLDGGMTVVPYSEVIPEEKLIAGEIEVFRQDGMIQDSQNSPCLSPCEKDIGKWRRDNNLQPFATAEMKFEMDDYAIWNLIKNMNHHPGKICRKFNTSLKAFENTVLCPKAAAGGATGLQWIPALILCAIFVIMSS